MFQSMLEANEHLTSVSLTNCGLENAHLSKIAATLESSKSVTELSLSGNNLTDVSSLSAALPRLQKLSIAQNQVPEFALLLDSELTSLDVSGNAPRDKVEML